MYPDGRGGGTAVIAATHGIGCVSFSTRRLKKAWVLGVRLTWTVPIKLSWTADSWAGSETFRAANPACTGFIVLYHFRWMAATSQLKGNTPASLHFAYGWGLGCSPIRIPVEFILRRHWERPPAPWQDIRGNNGRPSAATWSTPWRE